MNIDLPSLISSILWIILNIPGQRTVLKNSQENDTVNTRTQEISIARRVVCLVLETQSLLQDGAPKIAKLPYSWLSYGLW